MRIDDRELEQLARLARLEPGPSELRRLRADLAEVLDYFARVQEVAAEEADEEDRDGAGDRGSGRKFLRDDRPVDGLGAAAATAGAPDAARGWFRVPRPPKAED
jgi:aspartyl/glutamyl-tRNA(Asn/Gln) amidotransferase C subunit